MARIVVVEGDLDLRQILLETLGRAGHEVTGAPDGAALLALLAAGLKADLAVLDATLAAAERFRLARWLRERLDPRIVLLTKAGEQVPRELGELEYVAKPIDPADLVARVSAILDRRKAPDRAIAFGPYRLDLRAFDLLDADGRSLGLMPMEVDLVAAFATNPGRVLTRDDLLRLAPPRAGDSNGRSIDHRVTRLRRKLEHNPEQPVLIRTVRGAGYVFPAAGPR